MKRAHLATALAACLAVTAPALADDTDPRQAEARTLVKRFVGLLGWLPARGPPGPRR